MNLLEKTKQLLGGIACVSVVAMASHSVEATLYTHEDVVLRDLGSGYDSVSEFYNGYATVSRETEEGILYGLLNTSGDLVVPVEYTVFRASGLLTDDIFASEDMVRVSARVPNPHYTGENTNFYHMMYETTINYGFLDVTGKEVIPCIYTSASDFSEGLAAVSKEKENGYTNISGYIDKTGELVIPCIYDVAEDFSEGLAVVSTEDSGYRGAINQQGEVVIPMEYELLSSFKDGVAVVTRSGVDGDQGYYEQATINKQNEIVTDWQVTSSLTNTDNIKYGIDFQDEYSRLYQVGENLFSVATDLDGNPSTCLSCGAGYGYSTGVVCWGVHKGYDGFGLVNSQNEIVVPFQKGRILHSANVETNMITFSEKQRYGVMDFDGNIILPAQQEQYVTLENNMNRISVAVYPVYTKYTYLNQEMEEVLEPVYDSATQFYEGVAVVSKEGQYYLIQDPCATGTPPALEDTAEKVIPTWAQTYVDFVSPKIMPDISADNFDKASSRGYIAQSLYNMSGNGTTPPVNHSFTDVGSYGTAIAWCQNLSVMTGINSAVFGTANNVTREQFALILRQLATVLEKNTPSGENSILESFSDKGDISVWSKQGMAWAVENGLMSGSNGKLNPQGNITAVEVAVMLYNFNLL